MRLLEDFIRHELQLDEGPKKSLSALALAAMAGLKAGQQASPYVELPPAPAVVRHEPAELQRDPNEIEHAEEPSMKTATSSKAYSRAELQRAMRRAAKKQGLPVAFVDAIIRTESNYDPGAISNKGAIGMMQLMPATARQLGVDPKDPIQNIQGGTRYLKQLYDTFDDYEGQERFDITAAAYNAGPHRVREYGGIPPFDETQRYVERVRQRMQDSIFAEGRVV